MPLSRRNHPDAANLSSSKERANQGRQIGKQYIVRDDSRWPLARAYLVEKRMIAPQMVDSLHEEGLIYADAGQPEPNLIFLHRNAARKVLGASICRISNDSTPILYEGGINTAWFYIGDLANAPTIAAVESPIDALSLYSLKGDSNISIVSCAGAAVPDGLMLHAYDRKQSLVVAFNNTSAGEYGWQRAWDDTADWTGFKISSDCPTQKDWNSELSLIIGKKKSLSIRT